MSDSPYRTGTLSLAEAQEIFRVKKPDEAGLPAAGGEYPKMLYHDKLGQRVVNGQEEELELLLSAAGWRDHPAKE